MDKTLRTYKHKKGFSSQEVTDIIDLLYPLCSSSDGVCVCYKKPEVHWPWRTC